MTEEEKKIIIREKHPGRVAQDHKLAALMKKKEEILRSKKRSTEQLQNSPSVRSTEQSQNSPSVQSTEHLQSFSKVKLYLCLWRWHTCRPCLWCLCIFCIQRFS